MLAKNKGLICSLVVMLLWGLLFPMVKLGYQSFEIEAIGDILMFAGFRFLICGIVISAYSAIKDPSAFKPLKRNFFPVLLSGFFAIILHYGFLYVGLTLTNGAKTAILKQLGAVFYICFSAVFFPDDKLTFKKIIGLLLSICGIFAINMDSAGLRFYPGDLLIIAASFCTVLSNVISKKVFRYVEPIASTGVSQLFGGLVLLLAGSIAGGNAATVVPNTAQQFAVLAVILTASIISYCLWFLTVRQEHLSNLFMIKFAEPVFAAVFGWIILGEDIFNINYISAFLLISAGIAVANRKQKSQ